MLLNLHRWCDLIKAHLSSLEFVETLEGTLTVTNSELEADF